MRQISSFGGHAAFGATSDLPLAAGLLVSEVIGLKFDDIDSARMVIYVANGVDFREELTGVSH